jgi:MFS family permease
MSSDGNLRLVTSNLWMLAMLGFQAFALTINGVAAPWIMQRFHLNQASLARLFAVISVSAIGALILTRMFDVIGRRRMLRWCAVASSFGAIGAALSHGLIAFTLCEVILNAAASAAIAAGIVVIAEKLPAPERAAGQSVAGIALRVGSGFTVALMPLLAYGAYSWRWLLLLAATANLGLRLVDRAHDELVESQHPAMNRDHAGNALSDLMRPRYRRHAITFVVSALLSSIAITSSKSWIYFHAVSTVGSAPAAASVMLLIAGGLALIGYPLGAASSERFGRVPTVCGFAMLLAFGTVWSFWGPPANFRYPILWLGIGVGAFGVATNATSVGTTSSATELIPSGLRTTMIGSMVFAGAIGQLTGQSIVAALAPRLGGVSNVVGYLGLVAIGVSILYGFLIDESRGLALAEIAADDDTERETGNTGALMSRIE